MLKGKILKPNSTIGIIAPASPEDSIIINDKINCFLSLGFKVKIGKHTYDRYGYLAGTDYYRAEDLNNMFIDNEVDGIVCFRGGYGSIRTLPYINIKEIQRHPKFFCGYSDITILLNYFSKHGLITFHGPMINSDFSDKKTLDYFLKISSSNTKFSYNLNEFKNISFINKNSFSGRIVGGNLSVMCSSIGTEFEIDTDNSILLIEDVSEVPYSIDRMLTKLIYSGKFEKCNGIILGEFTDCALKDYSKSLTLQEVFIDRLKPLNIPIINGFPFGHDYPNIIIPIGVEAEFNAKNNVINIVENCLT